MTIDLMQATQNAAFAVLKTAIAPELSSVHVHVKQDSKPPMTVFGEITSENEGSGAQLERIEFSIESIYRGGDRGILLDMMHAARNALDEVKLQLDHVEFGPVRWIGSATAKDIAKDGVTYVGISNFEVYAEPA